MNKLKIVALLFTVLCGMFLFSACNNTDLSNVKLASNVFTYTGEEITPVFSSIPKGCEVFVYNENNEETKIKDAGNYIVKVKHGGNTKVLQIVVNKQTLEINIEDIVEIYNGETHCVDVQFNNEYDIEYELDITYNGSNTAPRDAGEYQVEIVLLSNNYYAYANAKLTIQKANCNVNLLTTNYIYSGNEFVPNIEVNCGEDYAVSCYCDNVDEIVNVGEYLVEIEVESNNYYAKIERNITITPKEISFQLMQTNFEYTGFEIDILKYIECSEDIEIEIINNAELKNTGNYEIIIKPKSNNYVGAINKTITIQKKYIELKFEEQTYTYNGEAIEYLTNNNYTYSVLYNNSKDAPVNAGEYIIDIEIIDTNSCGNTRTKLTINKQEFNLLPLQTQYVYTGENIEIEYNKNLSITKTIKLNNKTVSGIIDIGTYTISGNIEDNNYFGSFEFDITVVPKSVEIQLNSLLYEYTGNAIELNYTLSCDVDYSLTIYKNKTIVSEIKDVGLYEIEINIEEDNFIGNIKETIEVVVSNEENKIVYAVNKFYEKSSYILNGSFIIYSGIASGNYEINSYYNATEAYETYNEEYILKYPNSLFSSCSFFLYHEYENNKYEYERANSANKQYELGIIGNRESDVSNLGLVANGVLNECNFLYNNDAYDCELTTDKLEQLSIFYSYVFNTICEVSSCSVNVVINEKNEIENYKITMLFTYDDFSARGEINYNLNTNL